MRFTYKLILSYELFNQTTDEIVLYVGRIIIRHLANSRAEVVDMEIVN